MRRSRSVASGHAQASQSSGCSLSAMSAMSDRELKIPALCVRDQKITKHLHARDRLELFRIDEIGVVGERAVAVTEQLHQAAVLLDQIVRQHRDADAALA